ncbi:MAG: HNH endonuclease [Armatimonadetes bacterium]|nr:HNH endonuclease [Armatimonadota bacterium]
MRQGIWTFVGLFRLVGARFENDATRNICVFELSLTTEARVGGARPSQTSSPGRLVPTLVKVAVWKRDKGRCVRCGTSDDLHFDHIIPYSKGGSSTNPDNIQILCEKHNIEKSGRIV